MKMLAASTVEYRFHRQCLAGHLEQRQAGLPVGLRRFHPTSRQFFQLQHLGPSAAAQASCQWHCQLEMLQQVPARLGQSCSKWMLLD
jgi:hypothetical protein